jgi:hypothetical protein
VMRGGGPEILPYFGAAGSQSVRPWRDFLAGAGSKRLAR